MSNSERATAAPYLPARMIDAVIDLSHFNPNPVDFAAAARAGIAAAILKASQGADFTDPVFARRRGAAMAAGLLVGAYHFVDGSDPAAQAARFLAALGVAEGVLPVLDLEPYAPHPPSAAAAAAIAAILRDRLGRAPVIYTGRFFPGLPHDGLAGCDLWLPEYGTSPICPPGWQRWHLWQHTASGRVPGIAGPCDRSRFAGTPAELAAWWRAAGTSPATA